jgi:hypothetical protein
MRQVEQAVRVAEMSRERSLPQRRPNRLGADGGRAAGQRADVGVLAESSSTLRRLAMLHQALSAYILLLAATSLAPN